MATASSGGRLSKQLLERTRAEYAALEQTAQRLLGCLCDQFPPLLEANDITLGVPIESRVKTLSSVEEKLIKKTREMKSVSDVKDIVGVRIILLFRNDLSKIDFVIKDNLNVLSFENTADRLDETQFGYQSNHYLINLPESWLKIPSYADLGSMVAEVQVRTLAQHIWAAASHKFQYKREESVPPPLRRTIHRVSALLETVDLEFGRVLEERALYIERSTTDDSVQPLDVDLLAKILADTWPQENAYSDENFDSLLANLEALGVKTTKDLRTILSKHLDAALDSEMRRAESADREDYDIEDMDRYERGVFYTHVGLTREALQLEFGKKRLWSVMGIDTTDD